MTKATFGVLVNALVMNKDRWTSLPPEVAHLLEQEARSAASSDKLEVRKADERAFQNLLNRGYVANDFAPGGREEYIKVEQTVRDHLVGRVYPAEILARVSKIARDAPMTGPPPVATKQ